MEVLLVAFCVLVGLSAWRRLSVLLWLSSVFCALAIAGCTSDVTEVVLRPIPKERIREVCWRPGETNGEYFVFDGDDGKIVSDEDENAFALAVNQAGLIYHYDETAPAKSLTLIPLTRPDAWCNRVPKPTDDAVKKLLDPCAEHASREPIGFAQKNLVAQTIRSPFYCDQVPRMSPRPQDVILLREKNTAYQDAYDQARKIARALTQAEADIQRVTHESKWSLKRLFLEDPGKLEEIQLRLANTLNSIEAPHDYQNSILDSIALAGFKAGFDEGKFEVEAKLFAIDAGILIVEVVAMEVALGPLGGAKFLASAASKATRALRASMTRLGEIPIFIPGAADGIGGFVRARNVLKSLSRYHARRLEAAIFAEHAELAKQAAAANKVIKPLEKLATDETHHIVAQGAEKASGARRILERFGIDIDHPANGVFLPATKSSPNPKGSIVHKILGNNKEYYKKVEFYLEKSTSQADAIRRLRKLGELLENGTFFHANL